MKAFLQHLSRCIKTLLTDYARFQVINMSPRHSQGGDTEVLLYLRSPFIIGLISIYTHLCMCVLIKTNSFSSSPWILLHVYWEYMTSYRQNTAMQNMILDTCIEHVTHCYRCIQLLLPSSTEFWHLEWIQCKNIYRSSIDKGTLNICIFETNHH